MPLSFLLTLLAPDLLEDDVELRGPIELEYKTSLLDYDIQKFFFTPEYGVFASIFHRRSGKVLIKIN